MRTFDVPKEFESYVPAAVLRLDYSNPEQTFQARADKIEVHSASAEEWPRIRREIEFALYREKIYQETLPMRAGLLDMLSRT